MIVVLKANDILRTSQGDWKVLHIFMRKHLETKNWFPLVTLQSVTNSGDKPTLEWGEVSALLDSGEATILG